ncbi:hypothetical protein BD410DRAFT_780843 [Rickenella mellea]|uniref:Uncharacterized protein n=1 Tax=Rickenella mellea TaxID=50990 RepID=A0A4Y7QLV9_9AGAM|nr:hypothetical protein BD410DRAFT_780843 [Rickenella mellea]
MAWPIARHKQVEEWCRMPVARLWLGERRGGGWDQERRWRDLEISGLQRLMTSLGTTRHCSIACSRYSSPSAERGHQHVVHSECGPVDDGETAWLLPDLRGFYKLC